MLKKLRRSVEVRGECLADLCGNAPEERQHLVQEALAQPVEAVVHQRVERDQQREAARSQEEAQRALVELGDAHGLVELDVAAVDALHLVPVGLHVGHDLAVLFAVDLAALHLSEERLAVPHEVLHELERADGHTRAVERHVDLGHLVHEVAVPEEGHVAHHVLHVQRQQLGEDVLCVAGGAAECHAVRGSDVAAAVLVEHHDVIVQDLQQLHVVADG